ncbi:MAG TPA: TetR/AcrR family transcriptional regulator [Acidimicrobiales bacterium]
MATEPQRTTSLREERRRQQELLSQNHLLDAAEAVFAEKGFAKATVKEIAERSEFSVGAVYQFFESKEAVLRGVMRRRNLEVLGLMEQVVAESDDPRAQLHALMDFFIDWYGNHENYYQLFQQAIGAAWMNLKVGFDDTNWEQYEDILAVIARVFADGIAKGQFRDLDPGAMAAVFSGMMQAYLAHRVVGIGSGSPGVAPVDVMPTDEIHALIDRAFLSTE